MSIATPRGATLFLFALLVMLLGFVPSTHRTSGDARHQALPRQPPKKGVTSSRSFGEPVTELGPLREAVASYMTRTAEKLRGQASICGVLTVFTTTKHHGKGPHYSQSRTATLPEPTAYTPSLISYAEACLEKIYRPGYRYRKAGVMLTAIQPAGSTQSDLFEQASHPVHHTLMEVVDTINNRWGRGTVFFAASGTKQAWAMQQVMRSPRYTTRWGEVPSVRGIHQEEGDDGRDTAQRP